MGTYPGLRSGSFDGHELLATAAHELRGPLTTLGLRLDKIQQYGHDADRAHEVQLLRSEIERMRRLIDQYLTLGELTQRPLCMQIEEIDASTLIRDIVERIGLWAEDEPQWHVETGLRIWGDRTRLEQVLWNVLQNAYRYGKRPVQIAAWAEGGCARIIVSDCGQGIPEEFRPAALTMFEQGHDAHRGGLGIGLGLAAAIIEAHGGRQWIESAPCGGAAIHVELERVS